MNSKPSFPIRFCFGLALLGAFTAAPAADLSQATVRQKFNVVTLAPNINAPSRAVAQGAVIRDENVVRTGTESRAELEFTDLTLARIGANAIFSFDAQARSLECERGAVLFSKPAKSGRIEIRSGAVTAAITGSTGFISTSARGAGKKGAPVKAEEATTVLGMLEGKVKGASTWRDGRGRTRTFQFSLGAGEMLVAQPGRPPAVVQFDLPRFVKTSPLIKGFKGGLLNQGDLQKAVADYQADERRGFIETSNAPSNQPSNLAWLAYNSPNHNSFDASVAQLGSGMNPSGGGDFVDVGGNGIVRGQLVWTSTADLDLHLFLPDNQEVFYANPNVTFNGGRANAVLDHDNRGETIDLPPNLRVENIAVNGTLSSGNYTFFANSFATSNGSDSFTLTVSGHGHTQTITGTLADGQNSNHVIVQIPPGG
jgi:hypothetical protein